VKVNKTVIDKRIPLD